LANVVCTISHSLEFVKEKATYVVWVTLGISGQKILTGPYQKSVGLYHKVIP